MTIVKRILSCSVAVILSAAAISISSFTGLAAENEIQKNYIKKIPANEIMAMPLVQTSTYRNTSGFGEPDVVSVGLDKNKKEHVVQTRTPWAYFYVNGKTDKAQDGTVLATQADCAWPEGIADDSGNIKPAEIEYAYIGRSGSYSVGVKGFDFQYDAANINPTYSEGNGWNILGISTTFIEPEKDDDGKYKKPAATISNLKLNFFDSEDSYNSGTPDRVLSPVVSNYLIQGVATSTTDSKIYTEYSFANIWTDNSKIEDEASKIPSRALNKASKYDLFGVTGASGSKSSNYGSGYTGPTGAKALPKYAFTISFDLNVPDYCLTHTPDSASLKSVIDEAQTYSDNKGTQTLEQIGATNGKTAEEIKALLTNAITKATKVYNDNKDIKSASKTALKLEQKAIDDATAELKKILSDLGILVWGELEGVLADLSKLTESEYTVGSWAKLQEAVTAAKALQDKFSNGEAVTQDEIDLAVKAIKDAIDALISFTANPNTSSGFAYLQIADKNGDQKWYNDGNEYNVTPTTVKVDTEKNGESYTVSAKASSTATGIADLNVEVRNLKSIYTDAVVTIEKVEIDGKAFSLTGVPYTVAGKNGEAIVPLYDVTVSSIPEGAATGIGAVLATDASPTAVSTDGNTAVDTEWNEVSVTFTVNWTADEESKAPADSKDDDETPNPDTAGGIAVAASLVTLVAAGYVVSRRKK